MSLVLIVEDNDKNLKLVRDVLRVKKVYSTGRAPGVPARARS